MNTSRGFASLGIILVIVLGLAAFGGAGWWAIQRDQDSVPADIGQTASTTASNKTFYASPSSGVVPLTVQFTQSAIEDKRARINYGDGTGCGGDDEAQGRCSKYTHTYTASGTYTATLDSLTGTDAAHRSSLGQIAIVVTGGPGIIDSSGSISVQGQNVTLLNKEGLTFTLPQGWRVGTTSYSRAFDTIGIDLINAQGKRGGRIECLSAPTGFEGPRMSVASSSHTFTHAGVTYKASYSLDSRLDDPSLKPLYKKDDDMGNKVKLYDFFSFISEGTTTYPIKCSLVHMDVPKENVDGLKSIYASWR